MENTNIKKEYNYGLCILKIWMAFEVVYLHAGGTFSIWMLTAVPVFMTLSFLLATDGLYRNPKKRFERLLLPYLFWCVINYTALGIMGMVVESMPKPSVRGFVSEILCGTANNDAGQIWFLNNLILLSVMALLLYKTIERKGTMAFTVVLAVLCLIYEKVGLDFVVQGKVNMTPGLWYLKGAVTLPEMIPYMSLGMVLLETGVLKAFRKKAISAICIMTCFLIWYLTAESHPILGGGWLYGGLGHICVAFALVAMFYIMPLEHLPDWILKAIKTVGRYTMGIFLCHIIIKQLYENLVPYVINEISGMKSIDPGRLLHGRIEAVTVFAVSWLICFAMEKLLKETGRKLVT